MAALVDASVLIALERGALAGAVLAARYAGEDLALSAITASELLHGVHRARSRAQQHRREAFVEGLLAHFPVVAFDPGAARIHASVWSGLARRGIAVGERDLMIAATALARGDSVVTHDARRFPKIPGLRVDIL